MKGLKLIYDWIQQLPNIEPSPDSKDSDLIDAMGTLRSLDEGKLTGSERAQSIENGLNSNNPFVRDLFTRFVEPSELAPVMSGSVMDSILELTGNAASGWSLLAGPKGAICLSCHQVNGRGRNFGPPFDGLGRGQDRRQLLESILEPSKRIATAYVSYTIETVEGKALSGFIRHHSREKLTLLDAALVETHIPTKSVQTMMASDQSLMPAGLLGAFTDQEVADLLAYLASLTAH